MKIKILAATLFVILALIVASATPALALPPRPSSFYGPVKINGNNVPVGTHVSAWINGHMYADTQTIIFEGDSVYSFSVPGDDPETLGIIEGGVQNQTIVFTVGGVDATPNGTWLEGTNVSHPLTVSPTAVTLVTFSGTPHYNMVKLDWQTASEINLVGFNIYRSGTVSGVKQKQNVSLIPTHDPGQMVGSDYQFADTVSQGQHYFYWLELVYVDGNGLSDPVELTASYLMYMPLLSH